MKLDNVVWTITVLIHKITYIVLQNTDTRLSVTGREADIS